MLLDPALHSQLAAERAEGLRRQYRADAPVRQRLGLRLIALGERLADCRCEPVAAAARTPA